MQSGRHKPMPHGISSHHHRHRGTPFLFPSSMKYAGCLDLDTMKGRSTRSKWPVNLGVYKRIVQARIAYICRQPPTGRRTTSSERTNKGERTQYPPPAPDKTTQNHRTATASLRCSSPIQLTEQSISSARVPLSQAAHSTDGA